MRLAAPTAGSRMGFVSSPRLPGRLRMSSLPADSTFAGAPQAPHTTSGEPGQDDETETTPSRRDVAQRRHRPLGSAVLHAPQVLRALVRTDEIWLVVVAAFVGAAAGVIVFLMTLSAQLVHVFLFGIDMDQHLSAVTRIEPWWRTLVVVPVGGLV